MSRPYEDDLFISTFQMMHIATVHQQRRSNREPNTKSSALTAGPLSIRLAERVRQIKGHCHP
jgi:hypothetical protein